MTSDEYIAELKVLYEKAKLESRFGDAVDILQEIWERSPDDKPSPVPIPIGVPESPVEA